MTEIETHTLYELAGGKPAFVRLVDNFYDRVSADPLLRPLFPADFRDPKERLALFLVQYFGGPATYSEQRGHPRLRMRHAPFAIDQKGRDRWIELMEESLAEVQLPAEVVPPLRMFFHDSATFMITELLAVIYVMTNKPLLAGCLAAMAIAAVLAFVPIFGAQKTAAASRS